MQRLSLRSVAGVVALVTLSIPAVAQGRGGGPGDGAATLPPETPRFQYMGPASAGRVAAVAGVDGDTSTYYLGAASGGIWKSTDGARTWAPIFDSQPVQAIGALRVAPSDPRVVWAGTGEAWAIRDADVMGDGVYKSTDAGATWTNMGLRESGRIGRILIHPINPNIVFVCVLGRATGPQDERGVYRTTDGGATWTRVLFVDRNTGCSGLSMDAKDPNVLFASTWELVMHTWAMFSGGAGSGLYVTRDGGTTWSHIQDAGLPKSPLGKIDVAVAPSNAKRVYALIQTANQGSLWRSDDAGASWKSMSWDRTLIGRAGYYIRIEVNPTNENEVLIANSAFHRSTDGGATFTTAGGCDDCHDIWMDAKNPDRWVETGDAGAGITHNHGGNFTMVSLPIGQMYHVAVDNRIPYWIYSNRQDDGTMRGPSTSPVPVTNVPSYAFATGVGSGTRAGGPGVGAAAAGGGGEARGATDTAPDAGVAPAPAGRGSRGGAAGEIRWEDNLGGCESGFTIPDIADPNIVWSSCYGDEVTRWDARFNRARSVAPWNHTLDSPPNASKYRCHWTPPLATDPFDHNVVYYGCQVIFKTSNQGQSWSVISPDLSTHDSTRIVSSGGLVADNLGQFYGEVVFAIAPSPAQRGLIWAGTNDGKLWYTRTAGETWIDVTRNITGLPAWGTIRKIEPSPFDPATAYLAVDFHMMDDRRPYLFKTTDYGKTWKKINGDLPTDHPLSYTMSITENPNRKGMLFAGTGHGFYSSMDDGGHWTQLSDGLPAAPVTWIVVQKVSHDVVISTYGRGLFILHDISRMEQEDRADKAAQASQPFLYQPRDGIREARSGSAEFVYRLTEAPTTPVVFEVLDTAGIVIKTVTAANGRAGLDTTTWDLRFEGPDQIAFRTTDPDNPFIWDEPRFLGRATRPMIHWGLNEPQRAAPIAAPGVYSVRMKVGGKTYRQPFHIIRDPDIPSSDADLVTSTRMQRRMVADMDATVNMVNRLEIMRRQIEDLVKPDSTAAASRTALKALDKKLLDVELRLVSRSDLHSDDKYYVEPFKLYQNLAWLYGEIGFGAGDVQGGPEFRPTDASVAIFAGLERELTAAKAAFADVMETALPAFNRTMTGKLTPITDKPAGTPPTGGRGGGSPR